MPHTMYEQGLCSNGMHFALRFVDYVVLRTYFKGERGGGGLSLCIGSCFQATPF